MLGAAEGGAVRMRLAGLRTAGESDVNTGLLCNLAGLAAVGSHCINLGVVRHFNACQKVFIGIRKVYRALSAR